MIDSTHTPVDFTEDNYDGLDWYMNKNFKSRTVKVLTSVHGGRCKIRLMDDLLRGQHMPHHAQLPTEKAQVSAGKGSFCVASYSGEAGLYANTDCTEDDNDDGIGNMTLNEMRKYVRKCSQRPAEKQTFHIKSALCPAQENGPAAEAALITHCSLQLNGLELHLDSSTSNSAESSDEISPHGFATSFHKPLNSVEHESEVVTHEADCPVLSLKEEKSRVELVPGDNEISSEDDDCTLDSVEHESEVVTHEADCPELSFKERKSRIESAPGDNEISSDDDDCTLEMWKIYKHQSQKGKKYSRHGTEQASLTDKHISLESRTRSATALAQCSTNLTPDLHEFFQTDLTCPSLALSSGTFEQEVSFRSCDANATEKLIQNSVVESHQNFINCAGGAEGIDFNSDMQDPEVVIDEIAKTRREGLNCDELVQERGPLMCEMSRMCSPCGSPQADKIGRNLLCKEAPSWLLKPCSGSISIDASMAAQEKLKNVKQQPLTSCKTLHTVNHGPKPANKAGGGQSPLVKAFSYEAAITNSTTTLRTPFVPPIGATTESMNCECAELPQKNSCELSPVDLSECSPPPPLKMKTGFHTAEQSIHNVSTVSKTLPEQDISGSPVSLFSTDRLETEEVQGMEQHKPSKLPSKRKAISPLSRERLLQASKYIDCEWDFHDPDKRCLKKLPRAFKGFIGGQTTFHQEGDTAFGVKKNSATMESSPPEKLYRKEEILPGSPCHNREKFLPSKHFMPKVSSTASPYPEAASSGTHTIQTSSSSPSYVQRLSLVLKSSPSPPQQIPMPIRSQSPPVSSSPPIPAKGILRSSSPTCQGTCKCEECVSLRNRAEKAAEFSQRQMHDIEGLAVKLLKELNTMRCVVEESLINRNAPRSDSPRSAMSLEQVKRASNNALETEKMARSWLVRMARDCNRYCKIMRMQERKLTFADESGGQLCHVKLFHTQAQAQAQSDTHMTALEKPTMLSSMEKADSCLSDELALDAAS